MYLSTPGAAFKKRRGLELFRRPDSIGWKSRRLGAGFFSRRSPSRIIITFRRGLEGVNETRYILVHLHPRHSWKSSRLTRLFAQLQSLVIPFGIGKAEVG